MASIKTRTLISKKDVKDKVALMDRQGFGVYEIAKAIGMTEAMVTYWRGKVYEDYRNSTLNNKHEQVMLLREQYKDIRRAAWLAYYESVKSKDKVEETFGKKSAEEDEKLGKDAVKPKGAKRKKKEPKAPPLKALLEAADIGGLEDTMVRLKAIFTREGRLPANEYLQTILQTLKAEREMLGLDEAVKFDVTQKTTLGWDALAQSLLPVDMVEVRVAQALEGPKVEDPIAGTP